MRLNRHSELAGRHAFMSASSGAWLNYDDEKLERVYIAKMAAQRGTDLHAWAAETIRLGVRQAENGTTLNLYVNDCIGFKMNPEQPVAYSRNAFGTADALGFRQNILRIFDLKTGVIAVTKPRQLEIYAAYFCLEYEVSPFDLDEIDLRIYQSDECKSWAANPMDIHLIMQQVVHKDKIIEKQREELE